MADPLSITTWRNMFTRHGRKFGWGLAVIFGVPLVIGFGWNQVGRGNQQNADAATTQKTEIARVNGEPITLGEFVRASQQASRMQSAQPGPQFAQMQGGILDQLAKFLVLKQEAKRRGARASDADIDKAITQTREQVLGPKGSDAEWEAYVRESQNMSLSEFRNFIAEQMAAQALQSSFEAQEKVTEEEAKKQNDEVRLSYVLIPTINPNQPPMIKPQGPKPMPEAEAQKMANALLAKVKGGADIAAIAKANSGNFAAKKGGDLDWQPEFKSSAFQVQGKEFAEAVRKTPTGQFTEVVKVKGFEQGYAFAKVVARRNNPPKDFDVKKGMEELKKERAQEKLLALFKDLNKKAKIEVLDPEKKVYYDYFQWRQKDQQQIYAQFGQGGDDVPTKEEVEKLRVDVERELEEANKRNPKDSTIAMLLADSLKMQKMKLPLPEQEKINDRLITLYETALTSMEDRNIRFDLADLYRAKKQTDQAAKQYTTIARLLNANPPYNLQSATEANGVHKRLVAAFNSVSKPEDAAKQMKLAADTDKMMKEEQKKEDEKRKEQEKLLKEQQKAQNLTPPGGVKVAPGGSATVNSAVKPDAGKAEVKPAPSNTTKPDANKPDAGKPDAAKTDSSKPDSAKPDASKPDAKTP